MEEKEQKNEVPASDTGRKEEKEKVSSKPKKELTPQQIQQRKKLRI